MDNIQKVLKYMILGATLHDNDGNILYINPSLIKMLELNNSELHLDKPINQGIFNDYINDKSDIDYISNNTKTLRDEIIKFEINNDTLWIKMNSIIIKNGDEHIIITYENISETFNYSHLYKEIFNNIKSSILILKPYKDDFIIKDVNPHAIETEDMIDIKNAIGKKISTLELPKIEANNKRILDYIKNVYINNTSVKLENVYCNYTVNNILVERWKNIYLYSIKTGEVIFISDDITDIVRYKMKLEESDRQKTKFISNMSHEIRTPINTIAGFADLVNDMTVDEKDKRIEYVNIIKNSSDVLNNLIDDILDMSKIEAGKLSIDKKVFDANKIIDQLYVSFNNKPKNVKLIKKTELDTIKIFNDDIRLRQVISNLISNSIKFTKSGYIEFGYNIKDENIIFYVKDTGIGIKDEDKPKLFKRFQRLKQKTINGYGLGLSISNELAELMGGELYFESEYGKGSEFFLKIPIGLNNNKHFKNKVIVNKTRQIDLKDKTILLVEDVEFNTKLILSYLETTNVNVIVAIDGNDALIKYNENRDIINLILMDIHIPEIDGKEVTETIRSIDPDTPIIAQTAYAMTNETDEILSHGFNDLIKKPIKQELLIKVISKYMNYTLAKD